MIRHLYTLIANQWKSNLWIWAELFLSFVCLYLVGGMLLGMASRERIDKGFDIRHVYMVDYAMLDPETPGYRPDLKFEDDMETLAERVRRCPGVEAVGFTQLWSFPYTLNNQGQMLYADTLAASMMWGAITAEAAEVFRYRPLDGQTRWGDLRPDRKPILVRRRTMNKLFGEGAVRGTVKLDKESGQRYEAVGVYGDIACYEYDRYMTDFAWQILSDEELLRQTHVYSCFFLRVREEADEGFAGRFWEQMKGRLSAGNASIVGLTPMSDVRRNTNRLWGITTYYAFASLLGGFFLLCALLGTLGTFWFRTEARTTEVGLRMALGSTRRQACTLYVGEGLMLLAMAWVPGMAVAWLLHDVMPAMMEYELPMPPVAWHFFVAAVVTAIILLLVLLGTWLPARRAARVNPVEALHEE